MDLRKEMYLKLQQKKFLYGLILGKYNNRFYLFLGLVWPNFGEGEGEGEGEG